MKNISYVIIILILISCNNQKLFFSQETVKEYSKGDFKLPSVYSSLYMFVKVAEGKLGSTDINLLHTMYVTDYSRSYSTFESFLFEALNQKIIFPEGYVIKRNGNVFTLNEEIKESYDETGISKFLAQYCEEEGQKWSIKREYVNPNSLFTILYYFFINNYEVSNDDYIGKYYITKGETHLNP